MSGWDSPNVTLEVPQLGPAGPLCFQVSSFSDGFALGSAMCLSVHWAEDKLETSEAHGLVAASHLTPHSSRAVRRPPLRSAYTTLLLKHTLDSLTSSPYYPVSPPFC